MNTFDYYYWNDVISSNDIKEINSLVKKHREDKEEDKTLKANVKLQLFITLNLNI